MADRRCHRRAEILKMRVLYLLSLYGRQSWPLAAQNPEQLKVLDFFSLYRRCLQRVEILMNETSSFVASMADRRCLWRLEILTN